jgi:choline dehydrogenase-like flavoprotein
VVPSELTAQERRLRWALRIFAVLFGGETLLYLLPALAGSAQPDWVQLPFVANSFVKAFLFGGLCAIAAADVRRFDRVVSLLVAGLTLWVVAAIPILIWGETGRVFDILGLELSMTAILWAGIGLQASLALMFALLHRSAFRGRHGLRYLSAGQFRTLSAVTEALLTRDARLVAPDEAAARVDRYLAGFEAQRKWVMKLALIGLALYPLLFGRQPLSLMASDERRRFLEARFAGDVARKRIGSLRRWLVQAMIRVGQQLACVGYYGDPRTHSEVGYVPFSGRDRYDPAWRVGRSGLRVASPRDLDSREIEADVVVVGSGAAGALLAYRLAEAGQDVVVLERGRHVDPSEFSEDEAEMLMMLYRDGAVQLSRDFSLQILQGMCVGGSTVVNNAVCVGPPEEVVADWEQRLGGHLRAADLVEAGNRVRSLLDVQSDPEGILEPQVGRFQPGSRKFEQGIESLGLAAGALRHGSVDANIRGCLGSGYCNIGCAYGRKLSVLDTLLPWGQERFGPHRLRVISECRADRVAASGARVEAVECRLGDGRELRVRGDRVVVSAGAVNSSWLLMRSGLGGSRVGEGFCCNMGSPITAEFDEELHSYDGLQISHLLQPGGGAGFVMETWFNPVLAQALAMPGWFDDHRRNMRRYAHLTATGVLVGTETNGRVKRALTGGPDVDFKPTERDLRRLVQGLKLAGRIYLEAGARRVMPSTFAFHAFETESELERLDEIVTDPSDIQVGTGHPQGGNPLSTSTERGVVDPRSFRVHGTRNLYLCDASAFPTSIAVNPQMTVMSLAEHAAPLVAAGA